MNLRTALLLPLLFSSSLFAQFAPAPGFRPKSNPPNASNVPANNPTTTSPSTTPATTPSASTTTTNAAAALARQLSVPADKQWTDSGIDVKAGDKITFTTDGTIQFAGSLAATADGLSRGWRDLMRALPVNSAGNGALIGRIGSAEVANPFLVGKSREIVAPIDGRLFLGVNQLATESSSGQYAVHVAITHAAPATQANTVATNKLTVDLLKSIPRRVEDQSGNKGDLVNFIVIGDKEKLENMFSNAGWVLVDRTNGGAVLNAVLSSLDKKAYLQMPMSQLYMFGRPQDYGYAHAEPIQVVASRHHLRMWLSPETFEGKGLFVGAATHDIGFDRDQRNNGVTHKIDSNIDLEREFVRESLEATGLVASSKYLEPTDAIKEARTATGGDIKSDGRILVLVLR